MPVSGFDPAAVVAVGAGAVAYARGVRRRAGRGQRWPADRIVAFGVAAGLVLVATQPPVSTAETRHLWAHMAQHVLLGMAAPLALALAAPLTLALQSGGPATRSALRRLLRSRPAHWLSRPVVGWALFGGSTTALYLTPLLDLSARNRPVHLLIHAHLVVVGCLFVWPLAALDAVPRRPPFAARLLAVLCMVPFHAVLGLALASAGRPVAPEAYPSLSGQADAAGLMWGAGELYGLVLGAIVVGQWLRADRRDGARADRRAPSLP